jgi:two-component system invasion response regulator UvrY
MLRILIVDDHLIIRNGLKQLIEAAPGKTAAADSCSSQESLKTIRDNNYDVVLFGTALSATNSIELLKQVKAEEPELPVLILNAPNEEQHCSRLLRAGASGILTEQSAAAELMEALAKLSCGRKYISPSLAESLSDFSRNDDASLSEMLSDREYQVMMALSSGKKIKQIADEISLSIKTVSTYHSRILQKLKLDNNAQLIRYAIEHGIVQDSVMAREQIILNELNIRTAPVIASVREIWRQRKAIFIVVGIFSVIAFIVLWYLYNFIF